MAYSKIIETLRQLYHSRKTIDFLFSKRPNGRHQADLMEYDEQLSAMRLQNLLNQGFLQEKNGEYVLDGRLIEFFEDYLGIGDATVEMLHADIKKLEESISYYEVNKDLKYLQDIRSTLSKLSIRLGINVQKLYTSIDEVYKTEKDLTIKLMKLQKYADNRDEILNTIETTERFIELHQQVLMLDIDLFDVQKQLSYELIENRKHLLGLQNQIIEYIHKVRSQSEFYKKITLLKNIKKNDGVLDTANSTIREVASQCQELLFHKRIPYRTKVPLDLLLDNEEGRKVIERVRTKLKLKSEQRLKKQALPALSEPEVEESMELPIQELFDLFGESKQDLFAFIQSYTFPPEITEMDTKERISLFVEMSLDYEEQLQFHDQYHAFSWLDEKQASNTIHYQVVTLDHTVL